MQKRINNIKGMAMFVLEEEEFIKFENYLEKKQWNNLRLYLSDLDEKYELLSMLDKDKLEEWKVLESIQNEILDISIQSFDDDERMVNEGRKRIYRRAGEC